MRPVLILFVILVAQAVHAQELRPAPLVDCVRDIPAQAVFADRSSFRFCALSEGSVGNELFEWQVFRGTSWTPIGTTASNEITVTVGEWDRIKVRYRSCADGACGSWSKESGTVIATPGIDADRSGSITTGDASLICRDAVNPSLGKRERNGGFYQ